MRPILKDAVWERSGEDLYVLMDPEAQFVLSDPEGMIDRLLGLLQEGTRDPRGLTAALTARWPEVTEAQVTAALEALDQLGLLVDAAAPVRLAEAERERYFSNLAFFTTYASLEQSAASFQRSLTDSHVVFLGTGGLGSTAIQALAGAGVGRMTLLDSDTVDLRNFARQYLYREQDIGSAKVDRAKAWVRAFNSGVDVRPVNRWITGPDDVADLLTGADLVVSGVDQPADIDIWVNQACLAAGVPCVGGGILMRRIMYWSVDPGRSACRACFRRMAADGTRGTWRRRAEVNRGIGPVASLVGASVAMEALRYLTRFAEPIAAGRARFIDCATGVEEELSWQSWPECPVCATAPARRVARPGQRARPASGG